MANISRFEVYGPQKYLLRMGEVMFRETPHVHYFSREVENNQHVRVYIYEDQNTGVQSSRCVTCILSELSASLHFEIADVGRQSGFRGSQGLEDQPMYDQIIDFILDFSKKYGLTVQNRKES
ncbi:hypothetical protein [Natronogracilivirga saccharolytica]|uniref:Uncharacterized protein n=1 Tax=Natronogracilivirga saccharolytica TaxID=2812953 RepID=A0A8J7S4U1_9BACT|nr:hypothetical protein [Natronogracilivirga saccharolytica]MBP3191998.1 hypothetical protein [Natronogracilivirga saccharolytica]